MSLGLYLEAEVGGVDVGEVALPPEHVDQAALLLRPPNHRPTHTGELTKRDCVIHSGHIPIYKHLFHPKLTK